LSLGVVSALWEDQELGAVGALYSESTQALISVGDSVFVSLYLLLVGLWFEAQAAIRRHLMDPDELRARWLTGWLVANSTLYGLQICLFVALFMTDDAHSKSLLLVSVHAITAAVSFALPLLVLVVFVCSQAAFSGYPGVRTPALATRTRALTLALALWSLGRLAWGGLGVAEAIGWEDLLTGPGGTWRYALTISAVFIVGELLPATQALMGLGVGSIGLLQSAPAEMDDDDRGDDDGGIHASESRASAGRGGVFAGAGGEASLLPHSQAAKPQTPRRRTAAGAAAATSLSVRESGGKSVSAGDVRTRHRRGQQALQPGDVPSRGSAADTDAAPADGGGGSRYDGTGRESSVVSWVASGVYQTLFGGDSETSARKGSAGARLLHGEDSDDSSALSLTGSINHGGAAITAGGASGPHATAAGSSRLDGRQAAPSEADQELPSGVEAESPVAHALRADADTSADDYLQF
jgi:hypothetical protein